MTWKTRAIALFALALGCARTARYVAPPLPVEQLALITSDERASILSVDGLEPSVIDGANSQKYFYVATGCRVLLVKYDASYTKKGTSDGVPAPAILAAAISGAQELATREVHDYSTFKPIRFVLPTKPGAKYWVTASFNGAEFLPRIAELDVEGSAIAHVEPDRACP
jgi:hypothetical protein